MRFRDALKYSFHDMQSVKDDYVLAKASSGKPLNSFVVVRFIETQLLLIHPICPHFASKIWTTAFKPLIDSMVKNYKYEVPSSIDFALFPEVLTPSAKFPPCGGILKYWHSVKREVGVALKKMSGGGKKKAKAKKTEEEAKEPATKNFKGKRDAHPSYLHCSQGIP